MLRMHDCIHILFAFLSENTDGTILPDEAFLVFYIFVLCVQKQNKTQNMFHTYLISIFPV